MKNKMTNMALGDLAVVCVSGERGVFDLAFNLKYSLKEELGLAKSQGLNSIIFITTFMDKIGFQEDKFVSMVDMLTKKAQAFGFKNELVQVIPASLFDGCNLLEQRSTLTPWYNGPTLFEAAKSFQTKLTAMRAKQAAMTFKFACSKIFSERVATHKRLFGRVV